MAHIILRAHIIWVISYGPLERETGVLVEMIYFFVDLKNGFSLIAAFLQSDILFVMHYPFWMLGIISHIR